MSKFKMTITVVDKYGVESPKTVKIDKNTSETDKEKEKGKETQLFLVNFPYGNGDFIVTYSDITIEP